MGLRLLLGGGTGFIGKHLKQLLKSKGYDVIIISRQELKNELTWNSIEKFGLPDRIHSVINVAGVNVLNIFNRWNESFKKEVYTSRINTTKILANAINEANEKPKSFITISGVGIYRPSHTNKYDENSKTEEFDFFSKLCINWELAAKLKENINCRVINVRSGVVLGKNGGMINNLYLPFKLGLGGPIASGNQYLPWIHIDDITNIILFSIQNDITGVLNGVAPDIITNDVFTKVFAKSLSRPAIFRTPKFVFNILFGEERAKMLTEGQYVLPTRTLETGFKYKYPNITSACKSFN